MGRPILYVVAALIVVAGVAAGIARLRDRARGVAADIELIRGDTGDVMASATYQRFAARREGVAAMRAMLLSVAAAESTFVADSGRPTAMLMGEGRYAFVNDRSNIGPYIEIHRDRWVAKTGNIHSSISCTLTAMQDSTTLDSIRARYHAGEPVCIGWAAESTAQAKAAAPSLPAAKN